MIESWGKNKFIIHCCVLCNLQIAPAESPDATERMVIITGAPEAQFKVSITKPVSWKARQLHLYSSYWNDGGQQLFKRTDTLADQATYRFYCCLPQCYRDMNAGNPHNHSFKHRKIVSRAYLQEYPINAFTHSLLLFIWFLRFQRMLTQVALNWVPNFCCWDGC